MMVFEVKYRKKTRLSTVYHEWDVPGRIVKEADAVREDIGAYFDFEDGSGWYSMILAVSDVSIRTVLCVVRRRDLVYQTWVHYPQTAYSGVMKREEHELVREFRDPERRIAYNMINGYPVISINPRTKVLIMKILADKLEDHGASLDWVAKELPKLYKQRGTIRDKLELLKVVSRIHGCEIDKVERIGGGRTPLLQQFTQFNIQQRRRDTELPDKPQVKEIIDVVSEVIKETQNPNHSKPRRNLSRN